MDWGCDGKRQSGSLAIASWNTALKVRYLFPHIPFKPSKGCTVTKIHQRWVWLVCIWVWFPLPPCSFGWTQLRSFCLLSLVEQWPRSDQPLSPTQTPKDTTLRQHLHSGSRKQKYVGFGFFLISKCFSLSPWRWMFHARWRSSAKHVNKLLTDKRSATSAARDFLTFL